MTRLPSPSPRLEGDTTTSTIRSDFLQAGRQSQWASRQQTHVYLEHE